MTLGPLHLGLWDLLLIAGVTLQATVVAYVRAPRLKALVYSVPLPFSIANIALGAPVGTAHVVGLLNLLLYINLVRWLHQSLRLPIVPSIVASALAYTGIAAVVNPILPVTDASFWIAWSATIGVGVVLQLVTGHRDEPGHRSPLPVPVKAGIIAGVIVTLVLLKKVLGGFMATFPMVGVVGAYEARHSLWTLSRSGPAIVLGLGSMAGAMRLLQSRAGWDVAPSVVVGFLVWAAVALPILVRKRT